MARDGHEDIPRLKADRLAYACQLAGITPEEAKGPSQVRHISHRRFHVMALLKDWGLNYAEIGRRLNHKHMTITYGIRRWKNEDLNVGKSKTRPPPDDRVEKCIYWNGHTYVVQIRIGGEKKYFGSSKSLDAAIAIRDEARKGIARK